MLHLRLHPGLRRLRLGRRAARRLPGVMAIHHETSRCACSARLPIPRYPASTRTCSSSPCRSQPEGAGRDAGDRSLRMVHQTGGGGGSVPMCSFIPKCHWFPFLVWCISGSRALLSFPVDDGTEMMVASTMLPFFSSTPRSAR